MGRLERRAAERVSSGGGRVLTVTALGDDLEQARARAYEAVKTLAEAPERRRPDLPHRHRQTLALRQSGGLPAAGRKPRRCNLRGRRILGNVWLIAFNRKRPMEAPSRRRCRPTRCSRRCSVSPALGLCITALAAWLFQGVPYGLGLVAMIVGFILLLSMNACARKRAALADALLRVHVLRRRRHRAGRSGSTSPPSGPTSSSTRRSRRASACLRLAAVVYATGFDLRRFQGIFMIALLGLVVVGIISLFVRFIHPETYAWLTLVIFSGWC